MKRKEQDLQIECVKWFRLLYPNVLIFHVPNGGYRNVVEAGIFKAMGVVSGVPDLFIAKRDWSQMYNGLFIEMKAGKGKLTENQKQVIKKLEENGYLVEICRNFDEFKKIVENYL